MSLLTTCSYFEVVCNTYLYYILLILKINLKGKKCYSNNLKIAKI